MHYVVAITLAPGIALIERGELLAGELEGSTNQHAEAHTTLKMKALIVAAVFFRTSVAARIRRLASSVSCKLQDDRIP